MMGPGDSFHAIKAYYNFLSYLKTGTTKEEGHKEKKSLQITKSFNLHSYYGYLLDRNYIGEKRLFQFLINRLKPSLFLLKSAKKRIQGRSGMLLNSSCQWTVVPEFVIWGHFKVHTLAVCKMEKYSKGHKVKGKMRYRRDGYLYQTQAEDSKKKKDKIKTKPKSLT